MQEQKALPSLDTREAFLRYLGSTVEKYAEEFGGGPVKLIPAHDTSECFKAVGKVRIPKQVLGGCNSQADIGPLVADRMALDLLELVNNGDPSSEDAYLSLCKGRKFYPAGAVMRVRMHPQISVSIATEDFDDKGERDPAFAYTLTMHLAIDAEPSEKEKSMMMLPAVRAKMRLTVRTDHADLERKTLKFEALYDESIPEDRRFQKYTPWGSFEMVVDNPAALEKFELGKSYYVDFTPVVDRVPEDVTHGAAG